GTVLEDCSAVFRQRFAEAPLIIAKGQGNFETLSEVTLGAQQQLFFAFKVKCPVIAKDVGLPLGSFALVRAKAAAQSRH
ncbi:MAG: ARMT1-like domain-containing protein, partial [Myxococcota bacterium]|nr:ARMT1-like domain-containing protein [Myxococcota bacterium]